MTTLNLCAMICIIGLAKAMHIHDNGGAVVAPDVSQYAGGNIRVGVGYSGDSQQVTTEQCYNGTVSSTSKPRSYIQLNQAISFAELESKLGILISLSGRYEMFAADAEVDYMRSLQDKEFTMSLNYYEYVTNNVSVQIAGFGDEALTESGKSMYNNAKNPYFGLVCGDYYIASYQQGALLTMGLNIQFSSSLAKKKFIEKAGVTFGNIFSAANSIKSVVAEHKITGLITIQAFQIGGEPNKLSDTSKKYRAGQYYDLACDFEEMDPCIKGASDLLDYAENIFPTQFSFQNNQGLTPLGIAFSQCRPIKEIGLIPSVSLVTQEVVQYRKELASKLKENEYYQQKLYPFFVKGYPVELDNDFFHKADVINSRVTFNILSIMQSHGGAADCFNFPDKCKSIKASIDSQLENITISDLKFLYSIKYTIPNPDAILYNTGGESAESWNSVSNDPNKNVTLLAVHVTDKICSYHDQIKLNASSELSDDEFEGRSTGNGMEYAGKLCRKIGSQVHCEDLVLKKQLSPFFFEAYGIILNDAINDIDTSKHRVNNVY